MSENNASPRALHLITFGVLVIALATVFLVGLNLNDDDEPSAAATAPDTQARGIITTGKGVVTATPDQLTFTASVTNTRDATSAALAATNSGVRAVTDAAKKAGVDAKDIETAGLSVKPKYDYTSSGSRLVGYSSNQRLRIVVRTLADAGKVIGAVTSAGGNAVSVNSIKLSMSNRAALIDQARTEAVQKAKASAEAIAQAAGRQVGELEYVQEVDPQAYRYGYGNYDQGLNTMAMTADAVMAAPISPGEQDVNVTVQVRWSVAPAQ